MAPSPRYAEVLAAPATPVNVREKVRRPSGTCLERALEYVGGDAALMQTPMRPEIATRVGVVLDGLHPVAKRVLSRTHGIWFAHDIPDAAAVFLPCDIDRDGRQGGFILVDAGQFPLDQPLRDADVPALYWRSLAGAGSRSGARVTAFDPGVPTPKDHAMRYLVLHELGHALSLLAGEFGLDSDDRMQVDGTRGFVGYSWRIMTTERKYLPLVGESPVVQAVVPRTALDPFAWGSVLAALDADPELLAPGYAMAMPRSATSRARDVCGAIEALPRAGFITPTAARYPTEDFAEMFAHAILTDEGKLHADDRVPIDVPGCSVKSLESPYFSRWVAAKRAYVESALGLPARR